MKEKKSTLKGATGALGVVYGKVTEAADFIDAVYDALPTKRRKPFAKLHEKLARLYRYSDEIDMKKAFVNLVKAQALDYAIGKSSQIGAQKWKDSLPKGWDSPRGPGTGQRFTQSAINRWSRF